MTKIILITGASGSGKTTVLKELEKILPENQVSVNYFDDIGVPSFEDMIKEYGSCEKWQEVMKHKWFEKLNALLQHVELKEREISRHMQKDGNGMRASKPGEMIQIDHMTVTKNNPSMKHFQAWDPKTKTIVAELTSNATSNAAAKLLHKVVQEMPFKILSIQVDGGSEFMRHFEAECQKLEIPLYVLPPKRPQYNGGVERGNRTFREEFYANDIPAESIGAFKYELSKAVKKYNTYRPHFNLKGLTPMQYTQKILAA